MTQLSDYIHNELHSLLHEVQNTPHKKTTSLRKIDELVRSAPLDKKDKQQISREIKEI